MCLVCAFFLDFTQTQTSTGHEVWNWEAVTSLAEKTTGLGETKVTLVVRDALPRYAHRHFYWPRLECSNSKQAQVLGSKGFF